MMLLLLKLFIAWLTIAAVLVLLQHFGVSADAPDRGASGQDAHGCQCCPAANTCHSAQPARHTRVNQEEPS